MSDDPALEVDEEILEEEAPADPAAPRTTANRLSKETWAEVRRLYEEGDTGVVALSEKFKVSKQAIHVHFRNNKTVRGSAKKAAAQAATAAGTAAAIAVKGSEAAEFAAMRAERIGQIKNSQFKANAFLQTELMRILIEAKQAKVPIGTRSADIKALKAASETLGNVRTGLFEVLDIENHVDEAELPTYRVEDLTDEHLAELRNEQLADNIGAIPVSDDDIVVEDDSGP